MDAKLFTQEHDAVTGLAHGVAHRAPGPARAVRDVPKGPSGGFGRVPKAGLKGSRLALKVYA
jgi:hypothetical protein